MDVIYASVTGDLPKLYFMIVFNRAFIYKYYDTICILSYICQVWEINFWGSYGAAFETQMPTDPTVCF